MSPPPCPSPTVLQWSLGNMVECGKDFGDSGLNTSPDICQDIVDKRPIQLRKDEWLVVKLTSPITFGEQWGQGHCIAHVCVQGGPEWVHVYTIELPNSNNYYGTTPIPNMHGATHLFS